MVCSYKCVCVIYEDTHILIYLYICMHTHTKNYVYVYIYIDVICIPTYIYIHRYVRTYTYRGPYTIFRSPEPFKGRFVPEALHSHHSSSRTDRPTSQGSSHGLGRSG